MPRTIQYQGRTIQFPDDATDDEIRSALEPKPEPSFGETFLQTGADLAEGAKKGLGSTVYHAGDLIRRGEIGIADALGVDVNKIPEGVRSFFGLDRVIQKPEVQEAITPVGMPQKIGYGAEKLAEFALPGGTISKAGAAVTTGATTAKALQIAGQAGSEAAAAATIAGMQTGGDTEAMKEAALTAGVTSGALGAAGEVAGPVSGYLKQAAREQYSRVLNPTKQGLKYISQTEVVPGLLERRVVPATLKTLQGRAGQEVQKWGQAISDQFDNLPPGTAVDLKSVLAPLSSAAEDLNIITSSGKAIPKSPYAKQAIDNIADMKQTLTDVAEVNPATSELEVPVDRLRTLRQYFDKVAARAGRYQGTSLAEQNMAEAHGLAADAIRGELAKAYPDIAAMNKEYTFWKNALDVANSTLLRREGQARPLGRKIAGAIGAGVGFAKAGPVGLPLGKVAMDTFERVTTSPYWNAANAVMKDRLADALASGNRGAAEFYLGRIAAAIPNLTPRPSEATPVRNGMPSAQ